MSDLVGDKTDVAALVSYAQSLEAEIERLHEQDEAWMTTVRKQEEELVRLRAEINSAFRAGCESAEPLVRAATIEECAQLATHYGYHRLAENISALKEQR